MVQQRHEYLLRLILFLLCSLEAVCFTPAAPFLTWRQSQSQAQSQQHHVILHDKKATNKKGSKDKGKDSASDANGEDDDWIAAQISEVVQNNNDNDDPLFDEPEEQDEWIPDREKAKQKRQGAAPNVYQSASAAGVRPAIESENSEEQHTTKTTPSPYTEEEEEVIQSMGGRSHAPRKREPGYLGDSTLAEIAMDYSVPVCYLADVLCMWGVPVPINVQDRLGDLVTGEQAFAILEAVNSLDVAALNDRYSNQSLYNLCNDWNIDLTEAFQMAMKEGWSLPFGVHSVLRVEQEEELLRVMGQSSW